MLIRVSRAHTPTHSAYACTSLGISASTSGALRKVGDQCVVGRAQGCEEMPKGGMSGLVHQSLPPHYNYCTISKDREEGTVGIHEGCEGHFTAPFGIRPVRKNTSPFPERALKATSLT